MADLGEFVVGGTSIDLELVGVTITVFKSEVIIIGLVKEKKKMNRGHVTSFL